MHTCASRSRETLALVGHAVSILFECDSMRSASVLAASCMRFAARSRWLRGIVAAGLRRLLRQCGWSGGLGPLGGSRTWALRWRTLVGAVTVISKRQNQTNRKPYDR
eukprot:6541133-Prymnesium_polylepis.2